MKKYFWDNESERVISIEELEKIRSEFYPNDSMEKFMSDCSYLNNGSIEPLFMEIQRQKKAVMAMEDDLKELKKYVEYLQKIDKERV